VTRTADRIVIHLAAIGALALALGLAGCGRKGPLDLPPSAVAAEPVEAAPAPGPAGLSPLSGPPKRNVPEAFGPNGEPRAAAGQKKPLFLDWLID
jgi:predicted small lipoprotein YifL